MEVGKPAALAYRPDVDGLRAVAVLSIVLFQAGVASPISRNSASTNCRHGTGSGPSARSRPLTAAHTGWAERPSDRRRPPIIETRRSSNLGGFNVWHCRRLGSRCFRDHRANDRTLFPIEDPTARDITTPTASHLGIAGSASSIWPGAASQSRMRVELSSSFATAEIYNSPELRKDLLARGHRFSTATDVEVIVHLYEEYGRDCVRHLQGMFAFGLWDSSARRLLLARDPMGQKPLFYTNKHGQVFLCI